MVGWHHQLNGNDLEQTPGDSGGQRSLVCAVHAVSMEMTLSKLQEIVEDRGAWCALSMRSQRVAQD